MQFYSFYFIVSALFLNICVHSQVVLSDAASRSYASPLDIPMLLSGNYGEIRTNHFHAGIDIKTGQVEGKNVLAVDSGYVYRINVQSGGYGKALYIRHPEGRVTVYGHMSSFIPALDTWVREQQYRKQSFEVELYPKAGQFVFRRGALIGYSGNSGSSGGPHLHFEIRDNSGSIPFNPLQYSFAIRDAVPPSISWLAVYSWNGEDRWDEPFQQRLIPVVCRNGSCSIPSDTLNVFGEVGFGIETYDFLDNSANKCSPYTLALIVDAQPRFECRFDSIPFSMTGYVNSHVDYREKIASGKNVQKLFLDPNNKLGIYKVPANRGLIRFDDSSMHEVEIKVGDVYGNQSSLRFKIRVGDAGPVPEQADSLIVKRFTYNGMNVFENPDVRVEVPGDALFRDMNFRYSITKCDTLPYLFRYGIHDEFTPLFRNYILSIKPYGLPEILYSKSLIMRQNLKGGTTSHGGEFKNGYITARLKTFGNFFITVDTLPPEISPLAFRNESEYTEGALLTFRIADTLSGIKNYSGTIDKRWVLFEYDAKSDLLVYKIDGERLENNKIHRLEIMVSDNRDNVSRFSGSFYY